MRDKLLLIASLVCFFGLTISCAPTTALPKDELSTIVVSDIVPSATATETIMSNAVFPSPTSTADVLPSSPTPMATMLPIASPGAELAQALDGPPVVLVYNDGVLMRTDVEGSGFEKVTAPLGQVGDLVWMYFQTNPPQVSPDGRFVIVFNSVSSSRGNWQLVDLQTEEIVVTGQGQSRLSPTWSPNSQQFAYLDDEQICVFDLILETNNCNVIGPDLIGAVWSPAGEQIAVAQADFAAEEFAGQVWLFEVATKMAKDIGIYEIPPQATINEAFEWTIDGNSLLIKSTTENMPSVLYSVIDGTTVKFAQPVQTISPNGQYVLYKSAEVEQINDGVKYPLPTNEICPRGTLKLHSWDWSPDNEHFAYLFSCTGTNSSDRRWVTVLSIITGEILWQEEVTDIESAFPLEFLYWSPDGAYLLLDEPDELYEGQRQLSPIWRIAADGSSPLEIILEHGFLLGTVQQWSRSGED